MVGYPTLRGIATEQIVARGGKLAILEEIVRRELTVDIPEVICFDSNFRGFPDNSNYVLRSSSNLDVIGGFGISETYFGLNNSNIYTIEKKLKSKNVDLMKFYAHSIGVDEITETNFFQKQGTPDYWAVAMDYPNNPDYVIVNVSSMPSSECNTSGECLNMFERETRSVVLLKEDFSGDSLVLVDPELAESIKDVVRTFNMLSEEEITSKDYLNIMEAGIYGKADDNKIEVYQFTPVIEKLYGHDVSIEKIVSGTIDRTELPVIVVPKMYQIDVFIKTGQIYGNSVFAEMEFDLVGSGLSPDVAVIDYMRRMDERYEDGYVAIVQADQEVVFDIPTKNMKATIVGHGGFAGDTLNHSLSRLLYKSPFVYVGMLENNFNTHDVVDIESNGSELNIKLVK